MNTSLSIAILQSQTETERIATDGIDSSPVNFYAQAIVRAGAEPKLIGQPEGNSTPTAAATLLNDVQGIVLMGGGDVHPFWYHETASPDLRSVDVQRDEWEISCVHYAISRHIPCLGICRGLQVINVALGGSLFQSLPANGEHESRDATEGVRHEITIEHTSRLFSGYPNSLVSVFCEHHQAIQTVGGEMSVIARAPDGCIEGCERWNGGHWVGGVQWHPERTANDDPEQQRLFDRFISFCHASVARQWADVEKHA